MNCYLQHWPDDDSDASHWTDVAVPGSGLAGVINTIARMPFVQLEGDAKMHEGQEENDCKRNKSSLCILLKDRGGTMAV